MDITKSIPEFSVQISKSMFVVVPSMCEVDLCDISFLLSMTVHPSLPQ